MIHSYLLLIVYALCVHRVTRIITTDAIFVHVREFFLKKSTTDLVKRNLAGYVTDTKTRSNKPWVWFNELVNCNWCTSVWTGGGVVALAHFQGSWFQYVAYALALSSFTGFVSEHL